MLFLTTVSQKLNFEAVNLMAVLNKFPILLLLFKLELIGYKKILMRDFNRTGSDDLMLFGGA